MSVSSGHPTKHCTSIPSDRRSSSAAVTMTSSQSVQSNNKKKVKLHKKKRAEVRNQKKVAVLAKGKASVLRKHRPSKKKQQKDAKRRRIHAEGEKAKLLQSGLITQEDVDRLEAQHGDGSDNGDGMDVDADAE